MAAHAKQCVNIAVTSMKEIVARAIYGVTQACELRVRHILNRTCTELQPEDAAKLFSREQCSLILYIHAPVRTSYVHVHMCITLQDPGT